MDFDSLLRKLGEFGKYQKIIYFTAGLFSISAGIHNMGIVFIAGVPDHWCSTPDLDRLNLTADVTKNLTIPLEKKDDVWGYSNCKMYSRNYTGWTLSEVERHLADSNRVNDSVEPCKTGWTYDKSTYISTIVSEWDLVCDSRWLQATAASVYMAGLMAGVLIFGTISDLTGRYIAMAISLFIMMILGIVTAFSPNYIAFVVIRFFLAVGNIGLYTTGFVIAMEIVGPKWRVHCGIAYQYFWSIGYMLFAGVAYGVREWWKLQLCTTVPLVIFVVTLFIIPESPRWLYGQGKTEKGEKIVRKMAKANKVSLPDKLEINIENQKKAYLWDLLRTPRMRYRTLNIYFNWFVNSLVYYGLSLNTSNLGGNDYVNFFVSGAVEVPAYIICQVVLHFVGRRVPLSAALLLGGVALLCTLAVPAELNEIAIALAMIGKMCISASFAIIYVFTAELYPTVVRNIAVGSGSFFARVAGVVAPYIAQTSDYGKFIPLVIFGSVSVAAGLLSLLLPETKDQNLPETLEEGENFGRKDSVSKPTEDNGMFKSGQINPTFETVESDRL